MATERIGPGPAGRSAEPFDGGRYAGTRYDCWAVGGAGIPGDCCSAYSEADARLLVFGSVYGGLDDEAAGRAWCQANGRRPHPDGGEWYWYSFPGLPKPSDLPWPLAVVMGSDARGHPSEAAAYAAVGRALHALAAVLAGPPAATPEETPDAA